jgi:hypothetical protein
MALPVVQDVVDAQAQAEREVPDGQRAEHADQVEQAVRPLAGVESQV